MLWDEGFVFFGFNSFKLQRILGRKPACLDRFRNKEYLIPAIIHLILFVYVMLDEIDRFGDLIPSTIDKTYAQTYELGSDKLNLIGTCQFDKSTTESRF